MLTDSIVLVGAGGHARACIDVIGQDGRFAVAGLVGLPNEVGSSILGFPVLGTESELPALLAEHRNGLVSVGQIKSPDLRIRLFGLLLSTGCKLPAIISPRAYVSPFATIGAGSIVMHGATVNAGARIGRNCIINSHSLIEHDALIADYCHISTAASINGGARIGAGTFIGSNSCVRQDLIIGERCVIGMGKAIVADCDPDTRIPPARK